jgi:hypothetical protein
MYSFNLMGAEMTRAQAQSFWNLRYFIEDKSNGIHNPHFAAEMLYEAANNLALTVGDNPSVPCIESVGMAADNTYMDITFTEATHSSTSGTQPDPLVVGDFTLTFTNNGGGATAAVLDTVTQTDGSALAGGETTVRFNITVTGGATADDAVDTIEVTPSGANVIFDTADYAMPTTQTTGAVKLTDMVETTIAGGVVGGVAGSNTNRYIDVTFSGGVFASSSMTGGLATSDFSLTPTLSGTGATAITKSSVTQSGIATEADSTPLWGGESVIRVWLEITGTPDNTDTVVITPASATAIYDVGGNGVETSETTGAQLVD